MDYSEFREASKAILISQGIAPSFIDKSYSLYYDETNNVKKFRINEEKGKFNVNADTIFVLGGLEGKGNPSLEDLRVRFKLQNNVLEVKSHHIYDGDFVSSLKSSRLTSFLDLVIENGWHIHFQSLNLLYWSIVDIIDSVEKVDFTIITELKAMLYQIAKSNIDAIFNLMLKYRYPDIKDMEQLHAFVKELLVICSNYRVSPNTPLALLKQHLLNCLTSLLKQQNAAFIQDERELVLLNELTGFYQLEIYTWINSYLVFDNESDIIENMDSNIEVYGKKLSKYSFDDSKNNTMIQLSDVAVGIVAKYLAFIDQEGWNVDNVVSGFNELQKENFVKLNNILRNSRDYNPVFFHQTTSIEYHGLLNNYIDKYAR